ncbi:GntR family transcriptional regulator [Alkalilimnicola sp. S0819]|uniref:GntR family transcriptional regulator n=1 Tax=Alkalilimnicola sp. S0819 TaxID=2613922 RepID=UPI001261BC1E|nr:GntR family transcriptional regulator [Alkalilimnicola sp. S0819]KAB7622801.1 GntR family transcriptional regulator [Alkalilimnicola sp. S0819]MPQ17297.1 FCD domain-containing protein [Alkalilimnicola sp. S0819]
MRQIKSQKPLSELVYDALIDAICNGTLAPGERVTQDEVAERLNVSRLPVGQALKQLKSEGFLVEAGRRGLKVAELEPEFVAALYEFRGGLDALSAGIAARKVGEAAREEGERILARGRQAAAERDVPGLIEADIAFHWYIYELAGNPLINDVMQTYWHHIRRIMRNILGEHRNQDQVWCEHQAILDAICAGDVEAAEREARAHVNHAAAWLQRVLAEARVRAVGA